MTSMRYQILVVALASCLSTASFAQDRISISGKISARADGRALPDATIFIPDLARTTRTDKDGNYAFHDVPDGTYLLEFSHVGFQSVVQRIRTGSASATNVTLDLSTYVLDQVTVTGVSTATERRKDPIPIAAMTASQLRENATVFGDRLRPLKLEILLAELTLGFRIPYIYAIARYL